MIGQLRHSICRVLRDVEADERVQVTVDGRPVADLLPIEEGQPPVATRDQIVQLLSRDPLNFGFPRAVDAVLSTTLVYTSRDAYLSSTDRPEHVRQAV